MTTASLAELLARQLTDLRRANQQVRDALEEFFAVASSPEFQDAIATHVEQAKEHLSHLGIIMTDYPKSHWPDDSEALTCLIGQAAEVVERDGDGTLKDLGLIAACQQIKHYQIAGYGCARDYARRLGDDNSVELLSLMLEEVEGATMILTNVAEELLGEVDDSMAGVA